MNPTDAGRKLARKREINRNKRERDLQRSTPKEVSEIKERLAQLIEEEEAAKEAGKPHSKDLHIRRKVLQDAMKIAVAKERVCNLALSILGMRMLFLCLPYAPWYRFEHVHSLTGSDRLLRSRRSVG